jgi:hypothetical protein
MNWRITADGWKTPSRSWTSKTPVPGIRTDLQAALDGVIGEQDERAAIATADA